MSGNRRDPYYDGVGPAFDRRQKFEPAPTKLRVRLIEDPQEMPKLVVPKLMGKALGDHGENEIAAVLEEHLPYNYDPEQPHEGRRPDFSIHDDSGDRVAFVESKMRLSAKTGANKHDIEQTLEVIDITRDLSSATDAWTSEIPICAPGEEQLFVAEAIEATEAGTIELHICAPGGERFFNVEQREAIDKRAGSDIKVSFWDRHEIRAMVEHLKQVVAEASARHYTSDTAPAFEPTISEHTGLKLVVTPGTEIVPFDPPGTQLIPLNQPGTQIVPAFGPEAASPGFATTTGPAMPQGPVTGGLHVSGKL